VEKKLALIVFCAVLPQDCTPSQRTEIEGDRHYFKTTSKVKVFNTTHVLMNRPNEDNLNGLSVPGGVAGFSSTYPVQPEQGKKAAGFSGSGLYSRQCPSNWITAPIMTA